jgi:hypothetical protein
VQPEPCRDRRRSPPTKDSERARRETNERQAEEPGPPSIPIACLPPLGAAHLRNRVSAHSDRGGRVSGGGLLRSRRDRPRLLPERRPCRASVPPRQRHVRPVPWPRPWRFGVAGARPRDLRRRTRPPGSGLRQGCRCHVRGGRRCSACTRRRLQLLRRDGGRLRRSRLGPGPGVGSAGLAGRKQGQRIDVSVRLGGDSNSEVDGGHAHFPTGQLGRSDHVLLLQGRPGPHGEGAQVQKRDRIAVLGPQSDRPSASGNCSCERDHTRNRCEHVLFRSRGDFDATMLPGLVRVALDVEGPEDRAGDGPAPSPRRGGRRKRPDGRDQNRPTAASVVSAENHVATVSGPSAVVKIVYSEPR